MIYKISYYLCEVLYKQKLVSEDEKETYEYGFQITLANIINFTIMLTIGVASKSLLDMLLFYFIFVSFRFYCGGYHADSYSKCFLMFGMTCILSLLLENYVMSHGNIMILLITSLLLQGICIYKMAPIEHKNKPFTKEEKVLFKRKCWNVYVFWFGIGVVLVVFQQWEAVSVYLTTLILVSIFMLIEKIGECKHGKEKKIFKNAGKIICKRCKKGRWTGF